MSKIFYAVLVAVASFAGVAGAAEVPKGAGEPLPPFDLIREGVKVVRENDSSLQRMCDKFRSQQYRYQQFNGTSIGAIGNGSVGAFSGAAALQARREMAGSSVDTSYQASLASVPTGFNVFSCSGSYPTAGGSLAVTGGRVIRKEVTMGDISYQFEYGNARKYPVAFTSTRGNSRMSGIKQSANDPVIITSAALDFLKYDPKTDSYNSEDGKWTIAVNTLITFMNSVEPNRLFFMTVGRKSRVMSVTEAFQNLENPEFQEAFLAELKSYTDSTRPTTQTKPTSQIKAKKENKP